MDDELERIECLQSLQGVFPNSLTDVIWRDFRAFQVIWRDFRAFQDKIQSRNGVAHYRQETSTPSTLGISTIKPKFPHYAQISKRFESFEEAANPWPKHSPVKIEDLVEAGLVYTGVGDSVRCYYCGGGLRGWEDGDSPMEEHAKWYPNCQHVLIAKGKQFIQQIGSGQRPETDGQIQNRPAVQKKDPFEKDKIIIQTLKEFDFSEDQSKQAIQLYMLKNGGKKNYEAENLMVILWEVADRMTVDDEPEDEEEERWWKEWYSHQDRLKAEKRRQRELSEFRREEKNRLQREEERWRKEWNRHQGRLKKADKRRQREKKRLQRGGDCLRDEVRCYPAGNNTPCERSESRFGINGSSESDSGGPLVTPWTRPAPPSHDRGDFLRDEVRCNPAGNNTPCERSESRFGINGSSESDSGGPRATYWTRPEFHFHDRGCLRNEVLRNPAENYTPCKRSESRFGINGLSESDSGGPGATLLKRPEHPPHGREDCLRDEVKCYPSGNNIPCERFESRFGITSSSKSDSGGRLATPWTRPEPPFHDISADETSEQTHVKQPLSTSWCANNDRAQRPTTAQISHVCDLSGDTNLGRQAEIRDIVNVQVATPANRPEHEGA
ncbi:uncharacterized protein LOC127877942 isoform X2 [Dreissena polymorpha]|uniref:uncharacterized protein LOC127877942 isoform X2 n=1 Tax=Dreissena polymorpha TaxID=45954 RepID=UPI0022653BCA|nr:uncharacterized protein LOC127877942 isoform X2 [Dreissena polymorpha]